MPTGGGGRKGFQALGSSLERLPDWDPRSSPLAFSSPECRPNPGASVLSQLCLSVSNLVQGLNVHLGTLIGKTWESRGRGRRTPETL